MRHLRRCARVLAPIAAMTAGGLLLQAQPVPASGPAPAAQAQGPRPGGGPGPAGPPGSPPAGAPQSARPPATQPVHVFIPGSPSTTRPSKISLNFKDASLDTVLDYLSQAAGFVIIKEGQIDGRVTVVSKQPVTPEEAVAILNASLQVNGFVAVGSGRELRVLPRDKAKKGNVPVHFGADPKDIPANDQIITQVIPVQNVDAVKLREELKPLMPQDADAVTSDEASNTIVITDSASNIKHVVEIVAALDQHESTTSDIRVIQLKWANAAATVKLIEAIFKSGPSAPQGPQPGMPMQPGQPQPGGARRGGRVPGSGIDKALNGARINAAADDRTNTIVITGPTETLKVIDDIIAKLDSNRQAATELRAFPLKYADAQTISKLIVSVFKGDQSENNNDDYFFYRPFRNNEETKLKLNVAYDDRTNTVIVTAPPDILEAIEGLLKRLDANPGGASDIRIYPLKYADAYSVATLITSTFNPQDTSNRGFFPFFIFGRGNNEQKQAKVTATSDDRTNSLVVTAPTDAFPTIEKIVRQLDTNPVAEDSVFIYRLKNGQADNLEVVLNTLFGNIQGGQQQNQNNQQNNQPFGNQFQNNGPGRGGGGGGGGGGPNRNSSFNNRNNNNNGQNNRNNRRRQNGSQLSPGALQAVNSLTGQAFVVADEDTNSLIVTTATKYRQQVRQIIEELDRPVPQVLIKVLIAEVTHDNSADVGTDFSILNTRPNGLGESFGQSFGKPGSGLVAAVVENKLNVQLHALAVAGKLDVLSRPYILASDNQLASILVGSQVPFIVNSQITDLGQTINQIQYDPVGIELDVTPHINPDGLVIMDVAPSISQLTDQSVPISSTVSAPVIAERSAQSRVGVRDGQTVVIGGMMQDNKTSTINKVPILGDIPILKLAFSRTIVTKTKTELLIFLTPHVAQQPDVLKPMTDDELKGTRLTPRAVGPGVFDEQMKGLERGGIPQTRPANVPSIRDIGPPSTSQPADDQMQAKRNPTEPYRAPLHSE